MTQAKHGFCPACHSGWIRKRYNKPWECRGCSERFDKPLDEIVITKSVGRPIKYCGNTGAPL